WRFWYISRRRLNRQQLKAILSFLWPQKLFVQLPASSNPLSAFGFTVGPTQNRPVILTPALLCDL
ncbi:MAG TPA: hypothetical protein P5175_13070, partial [Anaerohalosphaeraceae bacterium]|nr:hypothetical protein [Anaerohalosphaeraceae bacterium]HRS72766.1 hypothetical protein [Anaerohalosphaeraceae bacterium]